MPEREPVKVLEEADGQKSLLTGPVYLPKSGEDAQLHNISMQLATDLVTQLLENK